MAFSVNQAATQAEVLKGVMQNNLVSKQELKESENRLQNSILNVKTDLEAQIEQVETRLEAKINQVETRLEAKIDQVESKLELKIANVETKLELKIAEVKNELIKWVLTTVLSTSVAQAAVIISALKFIH